MTMDAHAIVEWIETLVQRLTQEYEIEINEHRGGSPNGATTTVIRINKRES
jgi:hypothetical protein